MGAAKSKIPEKQPAKKNEIDFTIFDARVDRVNIKGISRTHDDYVQRATKNLFEAKTFQDILLESNNTRNNLNELGIFSNISIKIDVSKTPEPSKNGYEITFDGVEYSRVTGTVGTEVGQNEGALTAELATPNIFGRGERISVNGSYSSGRTSDINLKLWKPFYHTKIGDMKPETSINFFKHSSTFPWSKFKTDNFGAYLDFTFLMPSEIQHSFQYEVAMKEIHTLGNKGIPFFVREQSGPRLASACRYICSWDRRDNAIFPTQSVFIKTTNEISGIGGNVNYLMNNSHFEVNVPLFAGISTQFCARVGIMQSEQLSAVPISNLFILGGPLTIRGFKTAGVGPNVEGCATGLNKYWALGMHIWAPLPFNSYFGGFGDFFRTHLFYNCGNANTFDTNTMRSTVGAGLALRLGNKARIEFNYCSPILKQNSDHVNRGFQFGIGYEFL